jgi:hypothetical protein
MADSPATGVRVIETCWPAIEKYADLETSVAVALTCRSLHQAIIDPLTKRVKVTHFEVINSSQSAPARIPHYLSRSLNSIYFPSLQYLQMSFPRTKSRLSNDIDDTCFSSFPIFVTNLSSAYNLQRLFLNADRLMVRSDKSIMLEASYEIFAQNLLRCTKLRDLAVINSGVVSGHDESFYSVALLQAITGAVQKGKNMIDELYMSLGRNPSDFLYHQYLRSKGIDPVFDFFQAALTTESLKSLALSLSSQHSDSLFKCLEILSSNCLASPRCLKRLHLTIDSWDSLDLTQQPYSVHNLLDFFSESNALEILHLYIPTLQWEDERNTQALKKLLKHKHCLSGVTISVFGESTSMLSILLDCLLPNMDSKILCALAIAGLANVDKVQCIKLQSSLKSSGMVCEQFQVKINQRGCWDIGLMCNSRLREGESMVDSFDHFLAANYPSMTQ